MGNAIDMTPKLIPDDELLARDNSGGIDFDPYTAKWGDGGKITGGPKPHLAPSGSTGDTGESRRKEKRVEDKD